MKIIIERTSFALRKIYWDDEIQFVKALNNLKAKKILSIESDCPDITTTKHCSLIYFEYYI